MNPLIILVGSLILVACGPKGTVDGVPASPGGGEVAPVSNADIQVRCAEVIEEGTPSRPVVETLTVNVKQVVDGDTFHGYDQNGEYTKVRMFVIDAPERSQPYGVDSGDLLAEMIEGEQVRVEVIDYHGGRKVSSVYHENVDVSVQMLAEGMAWHYTYFANGQSLEGCKTYQQAQQMAFEQKKGLWRQQTPEPPWSFRRRK